MVGRLQRTADRLAEAEANDRNRKGDRAGTDFLRRHDDPGATARDRGYSHGELPGGRGDVHLGQAHWQNVPNPTPSLAGEFGELSPDELDEERRGEGALADERYDGDTPARVVLKPTNPRSWLSGWSPEAQAAYFVGQRHAGVWNDQAWKRYLERKKRTLPDPIPCAWAPCSQIFQPERRTAKYHSELCRKKANRAKERADRVSR